MESYPLISIVLEKYGYVSSLSITDSPFVLITASRCNFSLSYYALFLFLFLCLRIAGVAQMAGAEKYAHYEWLRMHTKMLLEGVKNDSGVRSEMGSPRSLAEALNVIKNQATILIFGLI